MSDDTLQITRLGLHPIAVIAVCVGTTTIGTGLGFGADALFMWFHSTFDSAPALVRAAAALPDVVTIVVLALAGLVFGVIVIGGWESETLVCEVRPDGIQTRLNKRTSWVARGDISSVYLDGEELVLADSTGRMLAVGKVDGVGAKRLARALTEAGYPWSGGGSPYEASFSTFVDGRDDLGAPATALIRSRATALEDGQKARARELRTELSQAGTLVRDRRGEQEYVVLSSIDGAVRLRYPALRSCQRSATTPTAYSRSSGPPLMGSSGNGSPGSALVVRPRGAGAGAGAKVRGTAGTSWPPLS